eukprot:SAG31_NODE_695_length_12765_cov_6.974499_8_plen_54_part_00
MGLGGMEDSFLQPASVDARRGRSVSGMGIKKNRDRRSVCFAKEQAPLRSNHSL